VHTQHDIITGPGTSCLRSSTPALRKTSAEASSLMERISVLSRTLPEMYIHLVTQVVYNSLDPYLNNFHRAPETGTSK
jgi:hypothetical protein